MRASVDVYARYSAGVASRIECKLLIPLAESVFQWLVSKGAFSIDSSL